LITDFLNYNDVETGILSFAKLRAAYGSTGKDTEPYYVYDRYMSAKSFHPGYPDIDDLSFPLGGVNSYMASNRLGNPNLENELTKEFEFGVEARLFNNRFGIDFSYYNRLTEGLIASLPKDPSSGYTTQQANLGDIRNTGIELVVDAVVVKKGDFQWDMSVNFATNDNKVEKLNGVEDVYLSGFGGAGIYAVEGKAIGQFKIARVKKVDVGGVMKTVVDGKGMPQQTTDMEYIDKDVNEEFSLGFNTNITWKGLSLGATFDYRHGGYMYSYTKDYLNWTGANPESVMNDRQTFLVPNSVVSDGRGGYVENTTAVDPTALHTFYSNGGVNGDEDSMLDRSYLKLRNVSLAYQLPKNICEKIHVNNMRFSITAANILIWTPDDNVYIDPETTTFGNSIDAKFGEYGAGPSNEMITFGLSFSL